MVMKNVLAVIGALSLILFVGSRFADHPNHSDVSSGITTASSFRTVTPDNTEISVPTAQKQLIDTINSFSLQYERASNEFQKSAVRRERSSAIETLLTNLSISDWVGTVDSMTTTGEGNGAFSVKLAGSNRIKVRTRNNQLSDIGSHTLISPTSPVYNQVASLASGQKVIFSGIFLRGRHDYLQESSITEEGSMTDPEFIFSFSSVSPALSAEQPRAALPVKNRGPSPEYKQFEAETDSVTGAESNRPMTMPAAKTASASETDTLNAEQPAETVNAVSGSAPPSAPPHL